MTPLFESSQSQRQSHPFMMLRDRPAVSRKARRSKVGLFEEADLVFLRSLPEIAATNAPTPIRPNSNPTSKRSWSVHSRHKYRNRQIEPALLGLLRWPH